MSSRKFVRLRNAGLVCFFLISLMAAGDLAAQSKEVVEGARKEGQLVFYSGMPIPDAQAILSALEQKYPFIKSTFYRATGSALVSRIQTEQRAGTHTWDTMNATGFEPYALLEQGYFAKYDSAERKEFPEGHKDNEGMWATMYTTPMVVSYNPKLVALGGSAERLCRSAEPQMEGAARNGLFGLGVVRECAKDLGAREGAKISRGSEEAGRSLCSGPDDVDGIAFRRRDCTAGEQLFAKRH